MLKFAILAAMLFVLGVFMSTRGGSTSETAYACSVTLPARSIDVLARVSDAVALVEVQASGGAENSAPPPTATPAPKDSSSAATLANFDLTGYGATVHVIETFSGALPPDVKLDESRRSEMEQGLRAQEAGQSFACPLNFFATRYTPGGTYLVLLEKQGSRLSTILAYRVEAGQALVADKFSPVGEGPQPLLVSRTLFERFLPTGLARAFDAGDETAGTPSSGTNDPIWTTSAGQVPLEALVRTIVAAQTVDDPSEAVDRD